jgi:hypothetical protein
VRRRLPLEHAATTENSEKVRRSESRNYLPGPDKPEVMARPGLLELLPHTPWHNHRGGTRQLPNGRKSFHNRALGSRIRLDANAIIGLRPSPLPVSPYSTFGGTCGCIIRRTIPPRSSPLSCWISIFCEIFGVALSDSESRRMDFARKREIILIFHRPSKHARTFSISLAHKSRCLLLKFFFRGAMRISPSLCVALWSVMHI